MADVFDANKETTEPRKKNENPNSSLAELERAASFLFFFLEQKNNNSNNKKSVTS